MAKTLSTLEPDVYDVLGVWTARKKGVRHLKDLEVEMGCRAGTRIEQNRN